MRQLTTVILICFALTSFGQHKDSTETINYMSVIGPMPAYPGGLDSLKTHIKRNLKYPKGTVDYVGVVYVECIVTEDGSATDFKVVKGLCDICDKNAIEALKKLSKWTPAMVDNKPARTRLVLLVKYEL